VTAGRDGIVWRWFQELGELIDQACAGLPANTIPEPDERTGDFERLLSLCARRGD
jgi:hypothetical protein